MGYIIISKEDWDSVCSSESIVSAGGTSMSTLSDEMKLEAFLENMGSKTLEQIQEFFKK